MDTTYLNAVLFAGVVTLVVVFAPWLATRTRTRKRRSSFERLARRHGLTYASKVEDEPHVENERISILGGLLASATHHLSGRIDDFEVSLFDHETGPLGEGTCTTVVCLGLPRRRPVFAINAPVSESFGEARPVDDHRLGAGTTVTAPSPEAAITALTSALGSVLEAKPDLRVECDGRVLVLHQPGGFLAVGALPRLLDDALAVARSLPDFDLKLEKLPPESYDDLVEEADQETLAEHFSVDDAREAIRDLERGREPPMTSWRERLVARTSLEPRLVEELATAFRRATADESQRRELVGVLADVGTEASTAAAIAAVDGLPATSPALAPCLVALQSIERPSPTFVALVRRHVEAIIEDPGLHDEEPGPTMTAGVVADRLRRAGDGAGAKALADVVLALLKASSSMKARTTALLALGAAAEPTHLPELEPYLVSEEVQLRAAATLALHGLPGPDAWARLFAMLQDPTPTVQVAVFAAIERRERAPAEIVPLLGPSLPERLTPEARRALAHTLVWLLPEKPKPAGLNGALERLAKLVDDETASGIRAMLGLYDGP